MTQNSSIMFNSAQEKAEAYKETTYLLFQLLMKEFIKETTLFKSKNEVSVDSTCPSYSTVSPNGNMINNNNCLNQGYTFPPRPMPEYNNSNILTMFEKFVQISIIFEFISNYQDNKFLLKRGSMHYYFDYQSIYSAISCVNFPIRNYASAADFYNHLISVANQVSQSNNLLKLLYKYHMITCVAKEIYDTYFNPGNTDARNRYLIENLYMMYNLNVVSKTLELQSLTHKFTLLLLKKLKLESFFEELNHVLTTCHELRLFLLSPAMTCDLFNSLVVYNKKSENRHNSISK